MRRCAGRLDVAVLVADLLEGLDDVTCHEASIAHSIDALVAGTTTALSLDGIGLRSAPASLGQLGKRCSSLQLQNNHLCSLPDAMCRLRALVTLRLQDNQLAAMPARIDRLERLANLDVNNNQLAELPASICELRSLQVLLLHDNQLVSLPTDIGRLSRLRTLTLTHNELTALPASVGELSSLKVLSLSNNKLEAEAIALLGSLRALRQLAISQNALSSLPDSICQLDALETLDVHDNAIVHLPVAIGRMAGLKSLNAAGNKLEALPPSICDLDGTALDFERNPLERPPMKIVKRGLAAIRNYFPHHGEWLPHGSHGGGLDRHTFDRHTFDRNTADRNTTDRHTGDRHTGDRQTTGTAAEPPPLPGAAASRGRRSSGGWMPVRTKRLSSDLSADSSADLKKAVGEDGRSSARHGRRRSFLGRRRKSEERNVQVPPVRSNAPPAAALSHRHGQRTSLANAMHRIEEASPAQAPLEALEA